MVAPLLNDDEVQYVVKLLVQRPLAESLHLYLKLTGQRIVPDTPDLRVVPDAKSNP